MTSILDLFEKWLHRSQIFVENVTKALFRFIRSDITLMLLLTEQGKKRFATKLTLRWSASINCQTIFEEVYFTQQTKIATFAPSM